MLGTGDGHDDQGGVAGLFNKAPTIGTITPP